MKKRFFITMLASLLFLIAVPKASADSIGISTYESEETITAVIYAQDISTPVIGLAFDLYYNQSSLSYAGYDEGAFFEQGGEPIYLVTDSEDHRGGKVIVGITLKRTDTLVDLSGTVMAINFQIINKNSTELTFKNPVISTINAEGQREDLEIDWIDAEISFQQPTTQLKFTEPEPQESPEELPELIQANTFSKKLPILLPLLLPLPFLCYILLVLIKKRRANRAFKTTSIGLRQPPQIHAP